MLLLLFFFLTRDSGVIGTDNCSLEKENIAIEGWDNMHRRALTEM